MAARILTMRWSALSLRESRSTRRCTPGLSFLNRDGGAETDLSVVVLVGRHDSVIAPSLSVLRVTKKASDVDFRN